MESIIRRRIKGKEGEHERIVENGREEEERYDT